MIMEKKNTSDLQITNALEKSHFPSPFISIHQGIAVQFIKPFKKIASSTPSGLYELI